MWILIGHDCPTDDTLPDDVAGTLRDYEDCGYHLEVFLFKTKKEAEEYSREDFWLPDGSIYEALPPPE